MGYKQCIKCGAFNEDGSMFCSNCGNRFFESHTSESNPVSQQNANEQSAFKYTQNMQTEQNPPQYREPNASYTEQGFMNSQQTQPQVFAESRQPYADSTQNPQYTQQYQVPEPFTNGGYDYRQQSNYSQQYQNSGAANQYAQGNSYYSAQSFYPQNPNMYGQPTAPAIKGFVKAFSIIGFILGIQTLLLTMQIFSWSDNTYQGVYASLISVIITAVPSIVFSLISLINNKSYAHKKYKTLSILGLVFAGIGSLITILALFTNSFFYFY